MAYFIFICIMNSFGVFMVKKYIKIEKKDLKSIKDDDYFLVIEPIWFSVNIYGNYKEYEESLKKFTLKQRYLHAIEWLIAEVDNGGFYQFFDNSTGIVWEDAYRGIKEIKCEKMLEVLDRVLELYGKSPSKIREERWDELEKFYDGEFSDKLDNLSSEFHKISESLIYEYMLKFIKDNASDFIFEGEVDIIE